MMNKYEEAWKKIKYVTNYNVRAFDDDDEEIKVIQELVDKATPKKVIDINDIEFEMYECPSCHCKWIRDGKEHYCHNCGQALLWKD